MERIIKQSLYADNIIICGDSRSEIVNEIIAVILALNGLSFKVHEMFSNLIPELVFVEKKIQEYGGHVKLHPEILRILSDEE